MTDSKDLKDRTKKFAVKIVRIVDRLPRSIASEVVGRQLVRSATSTGANYRAACRARSKAEFIAKLQITLEESDETQYWLELLLELDMLDQQVLHDSLQEADELTAIFVSALKTARTRR
jgi:four helix bundle protein